MIFATRFLIALAISEVAVGLEDGGNSNIDATYMYIYLYYLNILNFYAV